jgi:hypothetical protein
MPVGRVIRDGECATSRRTLEVTNLAPNVLQRLRKICLALPEAHEVEAWGEPTFRVRNKIFAMYAADSNHHDSGRAGVWIKAKDLEQDMLVRAEPARYFVPPYVGKGGWVGAHLDDRPDWEVVTDLLRDAYAMTAPKRLTVKTTASKRR